jgi:hypothetical protein
MNGEIKGKWFGILIASKLPPAKAGGNLWRRAYYLMCNFNIHQKKSIGMG